MNQSRPSRGNWRPLGRIAALAIDPAAVAAASMARDDADQPGAPGGATRDLVALYAGRIAAREAAGRAAATVPLDAGGSPPAVACQRLGRGTPEHPAGPPAPLPETPAAAEPEHACEAPAEPGAPAALDHAGDATWSLPAIRIPLPDLDTMRRVLAAWLVAALLLAGMASGAVAQQRYRVQEGDTLDGVAAEFGVDPEAIARASWMANPPHPAPGEILIIPEPGQTPEEAAIVAAEREGTSPWVSGAHWVEYGDSIEYISGIYGVDPHELAALNGIEDWSTLTVGQRLLIPATPDGPSGAADDLRGRGPTSSVWVPRYVQQRNLSCEYASVHIATSAFGWSIPEEVMIAQIPVTKNPHYGYRGNIDGWWGNYDDYGIYAAPLVPVLNEWGFAGEVNYTAGDPSWLIDHIDAGHPVITWLGYWGDTGIVFTDEDRYTVFAGMHVVVVYGYDDEGVYVSDPASGRYRFFDWGTFTWMWETIDGMALAVYPL